MIVLASTSAARRALLDSAGIPFEAVAAPIDERAVEAPLAAEGADADAIAMALAIAKARSVSALRPGRLVIGADQVLDCEGERFTKPGDRAGARRQIARLAGRTHRLCTAVALVRDTATVWQHIETPSLTMRPLSPDAIELYLDEAGEDIWHSVGAYHLEGRGIRLFSAVEGDYFSILGLPLLPLLGALRQAGVIDGDEQDR